MNKKYDLKGMRFGTLAVTGFNGRDKDGHLQWNCLCDCGNRSVVNGTALRNGSVKACKRCGHLKDITNQRFGYLTAKERVYQTENGMSIWKCQCDCGNVTNVPINHLTTHHTESCGHCIKNDYINHGTYCEGKTVKGELFLFSSEDWDFVTSHNWHIDTKGYVLTKINGRNIKLHRYIMPASEGIQIDHVNRKKYDCRRENLRYAVNKENAANSAAFKNNRSSGHKNVYIQDGKYRVIVRKNGKAIHFGYYKNLPDAVMVANTARKKLFGEYAFFDDSFGEKEKES